MCARVGSIGFFEANDAVCAQALLAHATHWLQRQGVQQVWAPFNANPYAEKTALVTHHLLGVHTTAQTAAITCVHRGLHR